MIYYNSRQLSNKLDINLAKWKRWVREFLPPDPLGGMQSGVTRQFNTKDAFKVYLGGYLVGTLKFTIPDAATILSDLSPWLKAQGFLKIHARPALNGADEMPPYLLFIHPQPGQQKFFYELRTLVSTETIAAGTKLLRENCSLIRTDTSENPNEIAPIFGFMIAMTTLYAHFLQKLSSTNDQSKGGVTDRNGFI